MSSEPVEPATLTPALLRAHATQAAAALGVLGVRSHHRVALSAANSPHYAAALLGLMDLGCSVMLIDRRQQATDVVSLVRQVSVDWLVADRGRVTGVPSSTSTIDIARIGEITPGAAVSQDLSTAAWEARPDALIAWSSGTTGEPKAIVRTGHSILANTRRTAKVMRYRTTDVLAPLLPFSHQYGMSLVLLAWLTGCSLQVLPHANLGAALPLMAPATVVDATPGTYRSMIKMIARRPDLLRATANVRMWCVGGAPLDEPLAAEFAEIFGKPLLDGYGSTELGNVALAPPHRPGSCAPLQDVSVWVGDATGVPVAVGEVGEVWVDSPDVMTGWWQDGRVVPVPPGPYRTHDLGVRDDLGGLRVLGRMAAVSRLGHTLYPDYLGRKAEECGRPVQVVPHEDPFRGWRLVFLVEDPERRSPHHWHGRFRQVLASYEQPNKVVVLERFPLCSRGKVDLRQLTEIAGAALGPAPADYPATGQ